jgi:hypothetical protein
MIEEVARELKGELLLAEREGGHVAHCGLYKHGRHADADSAEDSAHELVWLFGALVAEPVETVDAVTAPDRLDEMPLGALDVAHELERFVKMSLRYEIGMLKWQ